MISLVQMRNDFWDGLEVRVSASHAVGHGFVPRQGHTKDHRMKMVQDASLLGSHALGWELGSAA